MQPVTYRMSGSKWLLDVLSLVVFGGFFLALVITAGIGLRWLEVPGTEWIMSYGAAQDIAFFWLYLGTTVMFGLMFAFITRWRSPVLNYLTLDDTGLTYVFMGMRHTWPWHDVELADVVKRPFGMKVARLIVSGKFDWKTRLGLILVNALASAKRLAVMLPDFYETPIEDVVAGINNYRDQAVDIRGSDEAVARTPPQITATPGQPVTYAKSKSRHDLERVLLYFVLVIMSLVTIPIAAPVYLLIEEQTDFGLNYDALVLLLGLIVIIWPVLFLFLFAFLRIKPKNNFLALDGDGLTYMRESKRYTWSWQVLSAFQYQIPPTITARPIITVAAPGRDWAWWGLRLTHGLSWKPPAVVIQDIYDTPLEDIAATLNTYRERAQGGGNAAGGPPAPAQA